MIRRSRRSSRPLAAEIKATFGLPLVQAPQGVFRGRRGEENLLGYWVSDVMRQAAQPLVGGPVRFAITNAGGLRANLRPGQLKVGDIFELMPFENELVVIELTGRRGHPGGEGGPPPPRR